ncbi:MAG: bifunctional salicylyl-CoA 5-hydroxylase/oxidoreductase [Armatimonadetes bacterium]|nr:bifunctional salicylyl-CoA 5-hydroxylase/oxidoreductase [Armatimonadota bacterium]
MKIVCIGGGPAGLYFAISMKLRDARHDITVIERNQPDDTFGWGVVFSDQTMGNLRENDPASAEAILSQFAHWDDIDVHFKGQTITSSGHGFCGIARQKMLNILQERACELGIKLAFGMESTSVEAYPDADLIIASDGINSAIRSQMPEAFKPDIDVRKNKFIWLGTHKVFDAFTFIFEETPHGWIWAHAYRFDKDTSTFIIECQESTWRALGLDTEDQAQNIALCEQLFAKYLCGEKLMSNARHLRGSAWLNFPRITCEHWHHGNVVLMGDAAHTAHYSIGAGTKLAFEDAIFLADALHSPQYPNREAALDAYQEARRVEVLKLQSAARNSTDWFENVPRYARMEPMQFAYSLLTRSQRVSHENLRLRDKTWLEGMERWFAARSGGGDAAIPPMFTPFNIRGLKLPNRVAVSPMATYSAHDGVPNDFHLVHYGSRAQGGAGLIFTEMTCVTPEGRITPGCTGMYSPEQTKMWRRICDFVHQTPAKIAIQLGHSGPKGATKLGWEGNDQPLEAGGWELLAPSAVRWSPVHQLPREMSRADMDQIRDAFVEATKASIEAGFDMIELHCAHGYLLSSFITPLANQRPDEYGGSLENRLRFPLEVFRAMRAVWPEEKPMSVRISAMDWVTHDPEMAKHAVTPDEAVEIAKAFKEAGADMINVSSGQTSKLEKPVYGRMYQTPFSDRIRNEAGIATLAVGNIFEFDHVNSIIAAGRADLCCLARPHLADPFWTLHAAAQQNYRGIEWPLPYLGGRDQLYRNLQRAAEMAINV